MNRPSLLDPAFKYTPSHSTNIRARFDAIRESQAEQKRAADADTQRIRNIFDARRVK